MNQQQSNAELDREAAELRRTEGFTSYGEQGDPTPEMLAASEADRGVREDTEPPEDWN